MTESAKESVFQTVSLFLAVLAGIWETQLINTPTVLYSIQAALSIPTIVVMAVLAKVNRPTAFKFIKAVLKVVLWVVAVLAGSLFATGYTLLTEVWELGFLVLGFGLIIVYLLIRWIGSLQRRIEMKERGLLGVV